MQITDRSNQIHGSPEDYLGVLKVLGGRRDRLSASSIQSAFTAAANATAVHNVRARHLSAALSHFDSDGSATLDLVELVHLGEKACPATPEMLAAEIVDFLATTVVADDASSGQVPWNTLALLMSALGFTAEVQALRLLAQRAGVSSNANTLPFSDLAKLLEWVFTNN